MTHGVKLSKNKKAIERFTAGNKNTLCSLNANLTIGAYNEGNFIACQNYIGQTGYESDTNIIGNQNLFNIVCSTAGNTIGTLNISCVFLGQKHNIANSNIYCFVSGSENVIGSGNIASSIFGQQNTLGSGSPYDFLHGLSCEIGSGSNYNFAFGYQQLIASSGGGSSYNFAFGDTNTIASSSLYNFIFGDSNSLSYTSSYNFIFGESNDFSTDDTAINYNYIFANSCLSDASTAASLEHNFIIGEGHSFSYPNIQENFIVGNSHLIVGGTGSKYNAVFGYQNYVYGYNAPSKGFLSLVTGKHAKSNKYACHVNSGGHPDLESIPLEDMDEDCGAGQNIGMIPHSGKTTSSGFQPIYMNGGVGGEAYSIDENKVTLLVTYVVAAADAGERTKAWKIETLINRPLGGNATIVDSTVTVLGSTSVGGESVWEVKNSVSGANIYLEVNAASSLPVMWQAYGLGPEVISTEEYLEY